MPLTKQEAAKELGCKPRTLELYTQQGKLSVTYARGQRGRVAQYDETEVAALKSELDSATHRPAVALQVQPANIAASIAESLIRVLPLASQATNRPAVAITDKLALTLEEASELSGIPKAQLRRDIQGKKLKAIHTGAGYRIRRADLENYLKRL
jgi:excisionase family DNA binding protein